MFHLEVPSGYSNARFYRDIEGQLRNIWDGDYKLVKNYFPYKQVFSKFGEMLVQITEYENDFYALSLKKDHYIITNKRRRESKKVCLQLL